MPIIIPGNRLASTGHTISQSIRFDEATDCYMSRTPSSSGNQRTWTLSMWVKRSEVTGAETPTYNGLLGT